MLFIYNIKLNYKIYQLLYYSYYFYNIALTSSLAFAYDKYLNYKRTGNNMLKLGLHSLNTPLRQMTTIQVRNWSTSYSDFAKALGIPAAVESKLSRRSQPLQILPFENFKTYCDKHSPPLHSKYVGWDQGHVMQTVNNPFLHSKEFGSCIAVLARGSQDKANKKVDHLALHHIFTNADLAKKTLSDLIGKVQQGTVEIFISGGTLELKNLKEDLEAVIATLQKEHPSCEVTVKGDTFGICDIGQVYVITTQNMIHSLGRPGLSYAGFDIHQNPFQIINVENSQDIDLSTVKKTFIIGG